MKHWIVIVDATQTYSGNKKINDTCLERYHNKETDEETVKNYYYYYVLEARIYFGDYKLIISIASEFVENNGEDAKCQKNMSVEQLKQ